VNRADTLLERSLGYAWHLGRRPPLARVHALARHVASLPVRPLAQGVAQVLPVSALLRVKQAVKPGTRSVALMDVRGGLRAADFPRTTRVTMVTEPLAPVAARLVGAFAAVLVDARQTPAHLLASLDRAALLCQVGGVVSVLVHPMARADAQAAIDRLPFTVTTRMREHSVLCLPGGSELPTRMDHWLLTRVEGRLPSPAETSVHPDERIPHVPTRDAHSAHDVLPSSARPLSLETVKLAVVSTFRALDVAALPMAPESPGRAAWTFPSGGHLVVAQEPGTGRIALDFFPFHAELTELLLHHLLPPSGVP
jgi:hypothetical protein